MPQPMNLSRNEPVAAVCVADDPVVDTSLTLFFFQNTAASQQSRRNASRIGFRL